MEIHPPPLVGGRRGGVEIPPLPLVEREERRGGNTSSPSGREEREERGGNTSPQRGVVPAA